MIDNILDHLMGLDSQLIVPSNVYASSKHGCTDLWLTMHALVGKGDSKCRNL